MIYNPDDISADPDTQADWAAARPPGRADALVLVLTGLFVGGLALVAGAISFAHMTDLAAAHGQAGWKSGAFPVSVDGLELVASLYILAQHRAGRRAGPLPWAALLVGTAASLAANVAVGGADPVGRALAGWPAVSLLVSVKLLFSMFDHAARDHRTVRDDQRTVPDGPSAHLAVPDSGPDSVRPSKNVRSSGTVGGRGELATDPVADPAAPGTRLALGTPGGTLTTGAGRGGGPIEMREVAGLVPAARAAHAALAGAGRRLTRDGLADRMRGAGCGVSNARACLLVKILRAEEARDVAVVGGAAAGRDTATASRDQAAGLIPRDADAALRMS